MKRTIIAALAGLALVGCGQQERVVYVTETAAPAAPAANDYDYSLFEAAWAVMPAADRDDLCWGYTEFGAGVSYNLFMEGWGPGGDEPSLATFTEFFDNNC